MRRAQSYEAWIQLKEACMLDWDADDDERPAQSTSNDSAGAIERRMRALGWFGLGLGVAQVLVPGLLTRALGIGDTRRARAVMRLIGARELLTGVGILVQPSSPRWLRTRAAGD